ncbi:hypothetical protein H4582DRAFT_2054650 [Lactarius indigo]|nr:hypothetical protein H4582DRAFT_2054650 [Lactarius indigo]
MIVKAPSIVRGGAPPGVSNLGEMPSIHSSRQRHAGLTWAIRERGFLDDGDGSPATGVHFTPASRRSSHGPPLSGTEFLLVPDSNQLSTMIENSARPKSLKFTSGQSSIQRSSICTIPFTFEMAVVLGA